MVVSDAVPSGDVLQAIFWEIDSELGAEEMKDGTEGGVEVLAAVG